MKQTKQNSSAAVPVMDAEAMRRALRRVAHEIIERNPHLEKIVLAGIPSRGVEIARRIASFVQEIEKIEIETGVIDVAMHRDDVGTRRELPVVRASKLPSPLEGRTVVIVDDVLYTGRTVRAAMDAINSFGRPARIQLAVLVDRGHRELPIRPDYVGKNLPTASGEQLQVRLQKKPTANRTQSGWNENECTRAILSGAHASRVLVSASRRNELYLFTDLFRVMSFQEKSAIARTRSPARGTRALPRTSHDHSLDTQRSSRPARVVGPRISFRSRYGGRFQGSRHARDQKGPGVARQDGREFLR